MNYHSEKNRTKHEKDKPNIYSKENLLSISSEIKSLQRLIAILKQDLPKILRDELTRLKGNEY